MKALLALLGTLPLLGAAQDRVPVEATAARTRSAGSGSSSGIRAG